MKLERPETLAYTLRLTHTASGEWRATLYSAQSGERQRFATLAQLYAYLRQITGESADDADGSQGPDARLQNKRVITSIEKSDSKNSTEKK